MKKRKYILVLSIFFIGIIILLVSNINVEKKYFADEKMDKSFKGYLSYVIESNDPDMWGFEKDERFENITVGDGILVYYLNEKLDLETFNEKLYPVFSDGKMKTGIIMAGNDFVMTTGRSGYISENLTVYETAKIKNKKISEFNILSYHDQYLLMFTSGGQVFIIGQVSEFDLPKNEPFRFELFIELHKQYIEDF